MLHSLHALTLWDFSLQGNEAATHTQAIFDGEAALPDSDGRSEKRKWISSEYDIGTSGRAQVTDSVYVVLLCSFTEVLKASLGRVLPEIQTRFCSHLRQPAFFNRNHTWKREMPWLSCFVRAYGQSIELHTCTDKRGVFFLKLSSLLPSVLNHLQD